MTTTPLHELSAPNQKIVSGILDMYEAAWANGIPNIDDYVSGVTPDVLPTLLMGLVELETIHAANNGLFPQSIACATTPELKRAVTDGRMGLELMLSLVPTLRELNAKYETVGATLSMEARSGKVFSIE